MPFSSEVVSEWRVIRTELLNAARLIVTYLAEERSMPPFLPGSPALPPESR